MRIIKLAFVYLLTLRLNSTLQQKIRCSGYAFMRYGNISFPIYINSYGEY